MRDRIILCGILNCTPDSFSDGGNYTDVTTALQHAEFLRKEGATIIDIGGDSTRPGSLCVGPEEEWHRIKDLIGPLSSEGAVSVDTHNTSVAKRAISAGATYINDIGGGKDPLLWKAISESNAHYIVMFSRCPSPHDFSFEEDEVTNEPPLLKAELELFIQSTIQKASYFGVPLERLIIDPGMGAFISRNPATSLSVLSLLPTLKFSGCRLLLGISRKGFLRTLVPEHLLAHQRDKISAELSYKVAASLPLAQSIIFRVHAPEFHKRMLETNLLDKKSP